MSKHFCDPRLPNTKREEILLVFVVCSMEKKNLRHTLSETNSSPLKISHPKRTFHLPTIDFHEGTVTVVSFREDTWRIIPFSKWFNNQVGLFPFQMACLWLTNGGE